MRTLFASIVLMSFVLSALGARGASDSVLITNVSICSEPDKVAEPVEIYVDAGVVEKISASTNAPKTIPVIDGRGGCVTSGLINSSTTLGIEEVGLSTDAEDQKYEGELNTVSFEPSLAFNTGSSLIPVALEEGVTQVVLRPEAGKDIFAGLAQPLGLPGGVLAGNQALVVFLGEKGRGLAGKSRAAALKRLLNAFDEAELYRANRKAFTSNRLQSLSFTPQDLEVLIQVLEGDIKLALSVDRAAEISQVLQSLDEYDLDIVLFGAREAWKVADEIAERDIAVIIDVLDNRPSSFDRLGARLDQATLLHEAGITIAFMSGYLYQESRMLTQSAGVAASYGLPWAVALEAITSNPALIWGLENHGSLAAGAAADIVIWSGDPLELSSHATHVFVSGELQQIENRQKMLRDRYRDIDSDSKSFGYR